MDPETSNHSDPNDKLAGRLPATKAGSSRVVQKKTNQSPQNVPNEETATIPQANLGGLGGVMPNLVEKKDKIENVEEIFVKEKENFGKGQKILGQNSKVDACVPKVQCKGSWVVCFFDKIFVDKIFFACQKKLFCFNIHSILFFHTTMSTTPFIISSQRHTFGTQPFDPPSDDQIKTFADATSKLPAEVIVTMAFVGFLLIIFIGVILIASCYYYRVSMSYMDDVVNAAPVGDEKKEKGGKEKEKDKDGKDAEKDKNKGKDEKEKAKKNENSKKFSNEKNGSASENENKTTSDSALKTKEIAPGDAPTKPRELTSQAINNHLLKDLTMKLKQQVSDEVALKITTPPATRKLTINEARQLFGTVVRSVIDQQAAQQGVPGMGQVSSLGETGNLNLLRKASDNVFNDFIETESEISMSHSGNGRKRCKKRECQSHPEFYEAASNLEKERFRKKSLTEDIPSISKTQKMSFKKAIKKVSIGSILKKPLVASASTSKSTRPILPSEISSSAKPKLSLNTQPNPALTTAAQLLAELIKDDEDDDIEPKENNRGGGGSDCGDSEADYNNDGPEPIKLYGYDPGDIECDEVDDDVDDGATDEEEQFLNEMAEVDSDEFYGDDEY